MIHTEVFEMKKLFSLVLCVAMLLGLATPVSAADKPCKCGISPVIYVAALGSAGIYANRGTAEEKLLFRPDTNALLKDAAGLVPAAAKLAVTGNYDAFGDALIAFINKAFGELALDGDGNSLPYVKADGGVPTYHEHSLEQDWYFGYDFRLDPYEHAARLNKWIHAIKEMTGHHKVQLRVSSMGGMVAMAYLEKYGTGDIEKVLFQCCPFQGTAVAGELFNGLIEIDKNALMNYAKDALPSLDTGFLGMLLYNLVDVFDLLGIWGLLLPIADKLILNLKDRILEEALFPIFGSMPGIWSFVPAEYYDSAKKQVLDKQTQAGLIKKLDRYQMRVMRRAPEILKGAVEDGVRVYIIAGYNIQRTPLVTAHRKNSDGTDDTDFATLGATCAEIRGTLGEGYKQKIKDGHDHLSKDGVIDASTCALPEYTWFIRDMLHATTHAGHKEFYRVLLSSKTQLTVYDKAEYPQFLQNDIKNESFTEVSAGAPAKPFFSLKDFFKGIRGCRHMGSIWWFRDGI